MIRSDNTCKLQENTGNMAHFKKGESGNLTGRPKGSANLTTMEAKQILIGVLQKNMTPAKINHDLAALQPDKRLELLLKVATFIIPRPTEMEMKLNIFDNLSEADIDLIVEKLRNG
jgi:hypothetical protein